MKGDLFNCQNQFGVSSLRRDCAVELGYMALFQNDYWTLYSPYPENRVLAFAAGELWDDPAWEFMLGGAFPDKTPMDWLLELSNFVPCRERWGAPKGV